jgi:leucyl-tRNA synthetase
VELREAGREVCSRTARAVEVIPSAKMSKSKKNVVDPVNIIARFGADTARWFVLSDSPPERDVEWTAAGAEAAFKHLPASGGWRPRSPRCARRAGAGRCGAARAMHRAIDEVTAGIEGFAFNKAIAAKLYELTNALSKSDAGAAAKRRRCARWRS